LPENTDGSGKIDHLIVHVPASLSGRAQQAIKGIRKLWNHDGQEWNLWGAGEPKDVTGVEF